MANNKLSEAYPNIPKLKQIKQIEPKQRTSLADKFSVSTDAESPRHHLYTNDLRSKSEVFDGG
jgi:hypothetical protein